MVRYNFSYGGMTDGHPTRFKEISDERYILQLKLSCPGRDGEV